MVPAYLGHVGNTHILCWHCGEGWEKPSVCVAGRGRRYKPSHFSVQRNIYPPDGLAVGRKALQILRFVTPGRGLGAVGVRIFIQCACDSERAAFTLPASTFVLQNGCTIVHLYHSTPVL